MPDPSDDMLMALADDELRGAEAEALRARIAADPVLSARFAVFTESREALRRAFDPGATPERLVAAIRDAAGGEAENVVRFRPRRGIGAPLALAASLLLAVGAGGFLAGRALAPAGGAADPGAVAAAGLAGLGTGAGMDLAAGGEARVLGSYRTDRGLCRLIELAQADGRAERAVVCRDQARDWAVVATVAAGRAGDYIPASDTAAALIELVLDDLGAGPALAPAEEAAALAD